MRLHRQHFGIHGGLRERRGLDAIVLIPHGNISYGKLAQALEYGARTLQVEANFDQILALVRVLAERLGIYLLNSINPFRIEGQKAIILGLPWMTSDTLQLGHSACPRTAGRTPRSKSRGG